MCCVLQIVLDWLAKLLNLPSCFLAYGPDGNLGRGGGVIQVGFPEVSASQIVREAPKADHLVHIAWGFDALA